MGLSESQTLVYSVMIKSEVILVLKIGKAAESSVKLSIEHSGNCIAEAAASPHSCAMEWEDKAPQATDDSCRACIMEMPKWIAVLGEGRRKALSASMLGDPLCSPSAAPMPQDRLTSRVQVPSGVPVSARNTAA